MASETKKESSATTFLGADIKFLKKSGMYLLELCFLILVYGFLVNFSLYHLLEFTFNLYTMISYGLVSYFIKSELPIIVNASIPRRKD